MVYNAPKWFLALRQARMAVVGGFPSVDHMILRVDMCVCVYTMHIYTHIYLLLKLLSTVQLIHVNEAKR